MRPESLALAGCAAFGFHGLNHQHILAEVVMPSSHHHPRLRLSSAAPLGPPGCSLRRSGDGRSIGHH